MCACVPVHAKSCRSISGIVQKVSFIHPFILPLIWLLTAFHCQRKTQNWSMLRQNISLPCHVYPKPIFMSLVSLISFRRWTTAWCSHAAQTWKPSWAISIAPWPRATTSCAASTTSTRGFLNWRIRTGWKLKRRFAIMPPAPSPTHADGDWNTSVLL